MLSQAQLERKVEVFTTNGKRPGAQAVIGKVDMAASLPADKAASLIAAGWDSARPAAAVRC